MLRSYLSLTAFLMLCLVVGMVPFTSSSGTTAQQVGSKPVAVSAVGVPADLNCNTFSIVAYDPDKKEWGVGVASRVLAVGAVVPFGKAGVGAIATQAYANKSYGPRGLAALAKGKTAKEVITILTKADKGRAIRQVGIVDAKGNAANYTGSRCNKYAGAKIGKHYTCQGNILAGKKVIENMAKAFEKTKGALAWRIMAALEAAEKAGGDRRGKQSAAILILRKGKGYGGFDDRMIDLRVDDHKTPVQELARILAKHRYARRR